ncbi:ATP-binding protein [Mycolicibacterium sp. XJ1819]
MGADQLDGAAQNADRDRDSSIDELLDRAVAAINRGDRETASELAEQVLSVDSANADAEGLLTDDLLGTPGTGGEIRRLTLVFADLVDSTVLSARVEPETYRLVVGGYRNQVFDIIERYGGHIGSTKGDGVLAVFGHPTAHEDDSRRAVAAGLEITRAVARLSEQTRRRFDVSVNVRVGVHRGLVYLDLVQDDVYGFAANLVNRISTLAEPDTVTVSEAVASLVRNAFELAACPPAEVKGVDGLVTHHRVLAERGHAPRPRSTPLVGRDREWSWLRRAWQQVCDGMSASTAVAFRGEPGIGKTRLARAAAELVEKSGGTVIELRGSPLHTDTGLHPVRGLLERRCDISRLTDGAERLQLLRTEIDSCAMDPEVAVPLLAPVLGVGPEHGYRPAAVEGRSLYEMIGATVHRYLLACFDRRPGLVVAEDVHWFDTSTIDVLERMLTATEPPLLVVLTGRGQEWLKTEWPVPVFELAPLSEAEADALIEALDPSVTDAQRTAVRRRCDGVPFYIEHVVAALDAAGEKHVPEALQEPLLARLRTRADVVPVVEAAAVIGRSGDIALLRSVAGGGADVDAVVAELVKARVFEPRGADGWRFRHELLREVAAELAPPSLQRGLHLRAARSLAASDAEPDWRVVAAHYQQAERFDDAVAAYQKASLAARRRGALEEALDRLTDALGQLSRCTTGPARDRKEIAIRLERGFLAGVTQGTWSGEGPADFERCLALASSGDYRDELFTTLTALIGYYIPRAELRRAHELLDSLSARITEDRPWSVPTLASSLGSVIWLEGDFTAARDHLLRAVADASAADPRVLDTAWWVPVDPISSAHTFLALTHLVQGDLHGANAELAESVRRCDTLSFPKNAHNRAHTYFMEIWVALESGRISQAANLVAELREQSEQWGLDVWRIVCATERATVNALAALDEHADAATLAALGQKLTRRIDGGRQLHLNSYLTFHDAVVGRLLIAAGELTKARDRLEMALEHAQTTGMRFHDAELMRLRAHTLTDTEQRRAGLAQALDYARHQGAALFELRCMLDSFDLTGEVDRLGLAEVMNRFPDGPQWPEFSRAEQIRY